MTPASEKKPHVSKYLLARGIKKYLDRDGLDSIARCKNLVFSYMNKDHVQFTGIGFAQFVQYGLHHIARDTTGCAEFRHGRFF